MTEAELTVLTRQTVAFGYVFVACMLLLFFLLHRDEDGRTRWARLRDHFFVTRRPPVNRSDNAYGKRDASVDAPASLPSWYAQEGSEEGSEEASAGSDPELVTLHINALQLRERDAYELGAIHVYAALLKGGYLDEAVRARRLGALKQVIHKLAYEHSGLFGATSGNNLQRFNRLVEAVPVEPPAAASPPQPRRTPIVGREVPAGVHFAGEIPEDAPAA